MMDHSKIEDIWDDEFSYVVLFAAQVDFYYDEEGDGRLGLWIMFFHNRLRHGLIKPPFTWEAFRDNTDIINTLEGYELDIEKFWLVLLFVYDITIDQTINVADFSKTNLEILTEIRDYIAERPNARIYISDDEKLAKKNRFEITNPWVLHKIRRFLNDEIKSIEQDPELIGRTNISLTEGYNHILSPTIQMYLMASYLKTLYQALKLPDKRAKYTREGTDAVSYNKQLLTSRLLYFCRLTNNEAFTVDDTSLKGIIKEGKKSEYDLFPKVYI